MKATLTLERLVGRVRAESGPLPGEFAPNEESGGSFGALGFNRSIGHHGAAMGEGAHRSMAQLGEALSRRIPCVGGRSRTRTRALSSRERRL